MKPRPTMNARLRYVPQVGDEVVYHLMCCGSYPGTITDIATDGTLTIVFEEGELTGLSPRGRVWLRERTR